MGYSSRYNKDNSNIFKDKLIMKSLINNLSVMSLDSFFNYPDYKDPDIALQIKYEKILNIIKYKFLNGIRLAVAGRLTKRNVAARSIKKLTYIGTLKNIDSSYKGMSVVTLRGHLKPNLTKTIFNSKAKTGAFSVKAWTSHL